MEPRHHARMDDLTTLLRDGYGVVSALELRAAGYTPYRVGALVSDGTLQRVKRGWFRAAADPLTDVGRARLAGGALTCVSALRAMELWAPPRPGLHLRLPNYSGAPGAHHVPGEPLPPHPIDTFTGTMLSAQRCCSLEELVAILDEAAKRGWGSDELREHPATQAKLRRALDLMGPSDSAIESIVRVRLGSLRLKFTVHARVGPFELDFLIGDWLAVELDGFAYHSSQSDLIRDRKKDRYLASAGYTLLRFAYWDVVERWETCEAEILAMVRADRHRFPTSRRTQPGSI